MQDQGRAEMLRVSADRHQGLGHGLEQGVIDDTRSPLGLNQWRTSGSLWNATRASGAGSVNTTW